MFGGAGEFLQNQPVVQITIYAVLLLNAVYYYSIAAYTEMSDTIAARLKDATRWEWVVRVANQTILLALWFLLHFGWWPFASGLLFLYLTYFLWDWLTWGHFEKGNRAHYHARLDLYGFLVTVIFLLLRWKIAEKVKDGSANQAIMNQMIFLLGMTIVAYVVILSAGWRHYKFHPLERQYWVRPKLH